MREVWALTHAVWLCLKELTGFLDGRADLNGEGVASPRPYGGVVEGGWFSGFLPGWCG